MVEIRGDAVPVSLGSSTRHRHVLLYQMKRRTVLEDLG